MSFFISDALAEGGAAAAQQPNMIAQLLPLILLFVVFYFLLIRPQQKRAKEHKSMVGGLSKGDEVITQGGLVGRITKVNDDFVTLEVAENTQVIVQKASVQTTLMKGTIKNL